MEKYLQNRDQIQQGDIILFRGDAFISRAIRWLDKAPYNHAAIVFEAHGRKFVLESTGHGVNPRFLSAAMKKEKYTDFCVIRPQKWAATQINAALEAAFDAAQETIEYDYKMMVQIAIKRLTNRNVEWGSQRLDICSEFARRYARNLTEPIADNFEMPRMPNGFITPWDFVLYADPHFKVLFDDYKIAEMPYRERGLEAV
jgi:Permuted papain-like amidase enzyme, YaeF/YiiX, C92 family